MLVYEIGCEIVIIPRKWGTNCNVKIDHQNFHETELFPLHIMPSGVGGLWHQNSSSVRAKRSFLDMPFTGKQSCKQTITLALRQARPGSQRLGRRRTRNRDRVGEGQTDTDAGGETGTETQSD